MGARGGGGARSGGGGLTGQQKYYAKMSRNEIAKILTGAGGLSRWANNSVWDHYYNESYGILNAAAGKPNTFGGKIAKDILDRTEAAEKKYKKSLTPRVSSKQAWAIANVLSTK